MLQVATISARLATGNETARRRCRHSASSSTRNSKAAAMASDKTNQMKFNLSYNPSVHASASTQK